MWIDLVLIPLEIDLLFLVYDLVFKTLRINLWGLREQTELIFGGHIIEDYEIIL